MQNPLHLSKEQEKTGLHILGKTRVKVKIIQNHLHCLFFILLFEHAKPSGSEREKSFLFTPKWSYSGVDKNALLFFFYYELIGEDLQIRDSTSPSVSNEKHF